MNAMDRLRAQSARLTAMLPGNEPGKAMGAPEPGGAMAPAPAGGGPTPGAPAAPPAAPARPAAPAAPAAPPRRPAAPPPGGAPGGAAPGRSGDDNGEEPDDDENPDEPGKALQLPPGTEQVTLLDGEAFMAHMGALVEERVKALLDQHLAPVHKALDTIAEANVAALAGLEETGKAIGAMRALPAGHMPTRGVAGSNALPATAGQRLGDPPPVLDGMAQVNEKLKSLDATGRERVLMPLVYEGQIGMGDAQWAVNHGEFRADTTFKNPDAVKAALKDAR